jgi:hypothetical protein
MPTLDTIRRLRIVATEEGLDEVRDKLHEVADGQEAVTRTSERTAKGQLSVERSLDSVRKKYDRVYRTAGTGPGYGVAGSKPVDR